jgi:hypothetical protein
VGVTQESDARAIGAETAIATAHRAVEGAMAAIGHLIERYERGKLAKEDYDRLYPKRCEAREMACRRLAEAERRRADVQGPARRWDAFRGFFTDLEAKLEEADALGQEPPRSAPRSSGASSCA